VSCTEVPPFYNIRQCHAAGSTRQGDMGQCHASVKEIILTAQVPSVKEIMHSVMHLVPIPALPLDEALTTVLHLVFPSV
jgi:hypothetical protein